MPLPGTARALLAAGACIAALAWQAAAPAPADARGPWGRGPGSHDGPAVAGDRAPRGTPLAQPGRLTPEKVERWRRMSPEEREHIRERYRRWKDLPPERRERILERSRRWRELPESERRYLRERREMYRNAWPDEKRVIEGFFARMRQLPPERRRALKRRIAEWRDLPAPERDERLAGWPYYSRLGPEERRIIRRFLFSEPVPGPPRRD